MRAVTEQSETKQSDSIRQGRKAYPGATLRHLGSVRDVTLAGKTHSPSDGLSTKRAG
jgi:hypothetical protein